MKKLLLAVGLLSSFSVFANDIKLQELSKKDIEDVSKEFATNFTHTIATAPSTDGVWGVEVGVTASTMESPKLSKVVDASGGEGSEFETLYSGAGFLRVHVPFELFFETSILPKSKIADVEFNNTTFGVGWNAGRFFSLPFDLSLGYDVANGEIAFSQILELKNQPGVEGNADISLETATQKAWVGISKKLLVFTPYAKVGVINMKSTLKATGTAAGEVFGQDFSMSQSQEEEVKESSTYWAAGLQIDLTILSVGVEAMSALGNTRYAAKFAFSF